MIETLLNASGRVSRRALEQIAQAQGQAGFVSFMRQPVLAGASIQSGAMTPASNQPARAVNQTFVFRLQPEEESGTLPEILQQAIYPLVKNPDTANRADHIFTIGRIVPNDLIIPDLVISKRHAILEIRNDGYFIRDCKSTNGTGLNGRRLPDDKPRQIRDGDILAFARYEFTFLFPATLYRRLRSA